MGIFEYLNGLDVKDKLLEEKKEIADKLYLCIFRFIL